MTKNTISQALNEAHMDSVSDGLHERGGSRPVVLMAEVSPPQRTITVQTTSIYSARTHKSSCKSADFRCTFVLCCTWVSCLEIMEMELWDEAGSGGEETRMRKRALPAIKG